MARKSYPAPQGLYDSNNEHDSCGVGFIAKIDGEKTHDVVRKGLNILENLTHRGATGFDANLGDGAGILVQIPFDYFRKEYKVFKNSFSKDNFYGVGMFFLPKDKKLREACKKIVNKTILNEEQIIIGWRDVPSNKKIKNLSKAAIEFEPKIEQLFIQCSKNIKVEQDFERKLFLIRKLIEKNIYEFNESNEFYICSLSCRTIIYKAMLLSDQIGKYFTDLQNSEFKSSIALVHQRFSTNTFPSWELSQPFRMIAHNGEINTLKGNVNWMKAREKVADSKYFGNDIKKLLPLIDETQSDSAIFDCALEFLVLGGYSLPKAMMLLIPEAWEKNKLMDKKRRDFYKYYANYMEPWDGPAAVAFTDGISIGATLDRNGLRPARYLITKDNTVIMASENGVIPVKEKDISRKLRLLPGKMLLINTDKGAIIEDEIIKKEIVNAFNYAKLNLKSTFKFKDFPQTNQNFKIKELNLTRQLFGFTNEDVNLLLHTMATTHQEGIGSMGNDTPLAVLSNKNKSLYNYFKQLFAQVTNPPIDPIREEMVMSLISFIGPKPNIFDHDHNSSCSKLLIDQPVLNFNDYENLKNIGKLTNKTLKSEIIDIFFENSSDQELKRSINKILTKAALAVRNGSNILILSDVKVSKTNIPIPALLITSAIHHYLVDQGLRTKTGLVVATGSAIETHHIALLCAYGAEAVYPWAAIQTVREFSKINQENEDKLELNYIKAVGKGLFKIMSKMGISTFRSYCGSQIFEAIGLNSEIIDSYFPGTPSKIEGIGINDVCNEVITHHTEVFDNYHKNLRIGLDTGGEYAFRVNGEEHLWNSDTITNLQHSTRSNDFNKYLDYANQINEQNKKHMTLRGLFSIKKVAKSVKLNDVEPWTEIVKRFSTGAMSLGSISTEAHSTLAIAMNRIGGKSNTGEGGEDPLRYNKVKKQSDTRDFLGDVVVKEVPLKEGDSLRSKIKQVASGRFGVTAEYLSQADQIQIKIAQGAKPGEGGQLPGHKVSDYIAKLRFSVPGVGLISPPPHHDIYSIEDLAQLIHDLKNCNPNADISVKLVSEVGVGTVAAGVAKAKSDHITIAGYDGGTGASPLSSIKHAGTSWELGLAETQQTLVLNKLRGRIKLQVDGQMKTGRDVIIGALLGADEFGFATAPLVAQGCIMMRKCHLNTCPVGIATQNPELRKKFKGTPEHVINFFKFVAEEMRIIMSEMGVKKLNEIIGRSELLEKKEGISHWKAKGLDFSKIFYSPKTSEEVSRFHSEKQDHGLKNALDYQLYEKVKNSINFSEPIEIESRIKNINRTVGAIISGKIVKKYNHNGLPDDTVRINFHGTAGQSFGAFLAKGVTFKLTGDGNDYVGKGLSGGKIIIRTSKDFSGESNENIIVGNTVLYGAVGGEVFFGGIAGERFAVRNSGAFAVVEGLGDHGCEYMTGGTVVVLGETGTNFAAGMSGGIAYVYKNRDFHMKCNMNSIDLEEVLQKKQQLKIGGMALHADKFDEDLIFEMVSKHYKYTESKVAKNILKNWKLEINNFVKIFPKEYKRVLMNLLDKKLEKKKEVA